MERDRVNLSDPGVEPTDEQLGGLMKRAFANVEQAHQARLAQRREAVRLRVATLRAELPAKHPAAFFR